MNGQEPAAVADVMVRAFRLARGRSFEEEAAARRWRPFRGFGAPAGVIGGVRDLELRPRPAQRANG